MERVYNYHDTLKGTIGASTPKHWEKPRLRWGGVKHGLSKLVSIDIFLLLVHTKFHN